MGASQVASNTPMTPPSQGCQGASDIPCYAPMLFFDNLVKKLDNVSTSNIDIYPPTLEICINNLFKLLFFGSGPPPTPRPYQRPPHPPENHTYAQYFQNKKLHIYLQSMFRLSFKSVRASNSFLAFRALSLITSASSFSNLDFSRCACTMSSPASS